MHEPAFSHRRPPFSASITRLLACDERRNDLCCTTSSARSTPVARRSCSPSETDHFDLLAGRLRAYSHLIVLQGGVGAEKCREALAALVAIPDGKEFLVLATGRYIGEGFDDGRLDTLFLMEGLRKSRVIPYAPRCRRVVAEPQRERILRVCRHPARAQPQHAPPHLSRSAGASAHRLQLSRRFARPRRLRICVRQAREIASQRAFGPFRSDAVLPWAAARTDVEVDALIDSGIGQERLPLLRHLPDRRRSNVSRRSAGPGPRNGGPARGRQLHHAANRERESQCAHGDDRRKRVLHDPRSDPASATIRIQLIDLTTFRSACPARMPDFLPTFLWCFQAAQRSDLFERRRCALMES